MDQDSLIVASVALISKDFDIEEAAISPQSNAEDRYQEFLTKLTRVVKGMLDQDFNGLINALYKIDVSEKDFNQILETSPPDRIATHLAEAIAARQFEKVKTRERYRNF